MASADDGRTDITTGWITAELAAILKPETASVANEICFEDETGFVKLE